ncbi:MAG: IMPACT family protein [Planctomycetes bacterium]|nr:IMPACT family protein [Planctomycetota bacterium]
MTSHRQVPKGEGEAEYEDRGSRFLGYLFRAPDEAALKARLQVAKQEHPKARHWCWAWKIGGALRFDDDGEPSGTAGRPMLQVLEGSGLDEVAAICVRYFGGVKLGTGGLARAYSGATSRAMKSLEVVEIIPRTFGEFHLPFDLFGLRDEMNHRFPGVEMKGDHAERGWVGELSLPTSEVEDFQNWLRDQSRGSATWSPTRTSS